jgi:hypothetical protein
MPPPLLWVPVDDDPVDDADVEADVEAGVEADFEGDEQAAAADIRVSIAMMAVVVLARIFIPDLLPKWLRREPSVVGRRASRDLQSFAVGWYEKGIDRSCERHHAIYMKSTQRLSARSSPFAPVNRRAGRSLALVTASLRAPS